MARLEPNSSAWVAAREAHAREAFKRLQNEAHGHGVTLERTDGRDSAIAFYTVHRGRDLRRHATEADLRAYLGGVQ